MKAIVVKGFRDIKDFSKMYKPGDEIDFDEIRVKKCISLGLVTIKNSRAGGQTDKQQDSSDNTKKGIIVVGGKEFEKALVLEALKNIEIKVAANIGDAKLVEKLNELTEEETVELKAALNTEETTD